MVGSEWGLTEEETAVAAWCVAPGVRLRGAPAIGACGALGLIVALDERGPNDADDARTVLGEAAALLGAARPTAVNLKWAVDRVVGVASTGGTVEEIRTWGVGE